MNTEHQDDMADGLLPDVTAINHIEVVPAILEILCRVTGMGFAAVARVTEDRWVACGVRDEIKFGIQPGSELKAETTICQEVQRSREAIAIDHVAEDDVYRRHPTSARYGFQSYISAPIILADGTFFGTLCAADPRPVKIKTPETVDMFKMFAKLIAFHVDAIKRLESTEASLLDERKTAELREQFIAVLGHDLRNPLAAISGSAERLSLRPLDHKASQIVGGIQRSVARISGLIDNVLDFARGRLGGGFTLDLDTEQPLEPTLNQVVTELRAIYPDRAIEVRFALADPVHCERARVAQLFANLLTNALTHGAAQEPIRVWASTDEGAFQLSVSNAGEPISPAALEHLFQPFFRGAVRPSQQGLGLGLYIASEIARAHGGTIDAVSTPAETRFTFRMPLTPSPP